MAKAKVKEADSKKKGTKPAADDDAKAAKKAARMEALKNRPEGQRTNSKQVDVIDLPTGGKVLTFAYPIRKTGSLVTTVTTNKKGEEVSSSAVFIPGVKAKSKKQHGTLVPGVAGLGKKGKDEEEDEDDE